VIRKLFHKPDERSAQILRDGRQQLLELVDDDQ